MATNTGTPWNIHRIEGGDQVALVGDQNAMATTVHAALTDLLQMANSAAQGARWYRGVLANIGDLRTLSEGAYLVSTFAAAGTATPPLPDRGAGLLEVKGSGSVRTVKWEPIGTTVRPKPTWKNEYNSSYEGGWYGWHRTDSFVATPVLQPMVAVYGDSQSAGTNWPTYAEELFSTTSVSNFAYGGATSDEVLYRAGAKPLVVHVDGGQIPASDTETVTLSPVTRMWLGSSARTFAATIDGVPGLLTSLGDEQWTFKRNTAGPAVPTPGAVAVGPTGTTAAPTVVFWMGGNDFNGGVTGLEASTADHVVGNYRAAIDWARRAGKQAVVCGTTNRLTAITGSEGFAQVQSINDRLRSMFPDIFIDVQAYYSGPALADAGLTPTSEDLAAMGRGEIPPQLFVDDVHLSDAAHQAIAVNLIGPWLQAKGYAW